MWQGCTVWTCRELGVMVITPPEFVMYEADKGCLVAKGAGVELRRLRRMSGMSK